MTPAAVRMGTNVDALTQQRLNGRMTPAAVRMGTKMSFLNPFLQWSNDARCGADGNSQLETDQDWKKVE